MDHSFCPGSKLLRQPAPELFPCPNCGTEVEIWTDEIRRICPSCKKTVFKESGLACLDWCKYGKDCVGEATYANYRQNKTVGIRQKLLERLEQQFGSDARRIDHAKEVLRYAERLASAEGADLHIVVPAAILHDIGIRAAEEQHGSAEARYQELEGPPIAKGILLKLGFQMSDIDEICLIIGRHHTPRAEETPNFKVVFDADCLANARRAAHEKSVEELRSFVDSHLLTTSGRELAKEVLLNRTADKAARY